MSLSQSAIVPEAGPFALFVQLKVLSNKEKVLAELQQLPALVAEINELQAGADLRISVAFSHAFWIQTQMPVPSELVAFKPLGQGNTTAPATDVDVLIHCHSNRHDLHFYLMRKLMEVIASDVKVVDETYSYRYLDARDMTDFIDGTENPEGDERADVAIIPEGEFAGGSYVMVQRFVHKLDAWHRMSVEQQEKVIGRTKPDSVELDDVPVNSHVGRVDVKEEGKGLKIVRHSLPYGTVTGEHGLLFSAYCNNMHNIQTLLASMYGEKDGTTDQLLRFTQAVTGAYFFAPSAEMLQDMTF